MNENENPIEPEISPELAALAMMLGDVQHELREQRAILMMFAQAAGHPIVTMSRLPESHGLEAGLEGFLTLVRRMRAADTGEEPRGPDAPVSGG